MCNVFLRAISESWIFNISTAKKKRKKQPIYFLGSYKRKKIALTLQKTKQLKSFKSFYCAKEKIGRGKSRG